MPPYSVWQGRVRGCLLGGAVGDALGAPFEGWPTVAGREVDRWAASDRRLSWTDDTALQLALAGYLAELESPTDFDEDRLAREFARVWHDEPWRGYGANPPTIFRTVLSGGDWRAAARSSFGGRGSLGNGGAMRAAPIGVLPADPDLLAAIARRSAAITHAHPVGQDGAVLIALAAQAVLVRRGDGRTVDPAGLIDTVASYLETPELRRAVDMVRETLDVAAPRAVGRAIGTGITAHEAAPAALSAFLHHPADPMAAVRFAITMGGDTDTIAAMAGSLAGAASGATSWPPAVLDRLERRDHIEQVAQALADRTYPGP
jgi:poly(ADP-ribose) glycohydrolase ARH3